MDQSLILTNKTSSADSKKKVTVYSYTANVLRRKTLAIMYTKHNIHWKTFAVHQA